MFATQADLDVAQPPPASRPVAPPLAADALHDAEDELAPARGVLYGMGLGLLSVGILGGAIWWAL